MLGLDEEAAATLRANLASDRAYVVIARDVLPSTSERIRPRSRTAGSPT